MQIDREFTPEDRLEINPSNSISINQGKKICLFHLHFNEKHVIFIFKRWTL